MIDQSDWNIFARNMLKFEMKRRDMSYAELARLTAKSEGDLSSEIEGGDLSAGLLLLCLTALGVHELKF